MEEEFLCQTEAFWELFVDHDYFTSQLLAAKGSKICEPPL